MAGGGSAGAVIANRLSENCAYTVLLIEAGGTENQLSDVPLIAGALQVNGTFSPLPKTISCLTTCGVSSNRSSSPHV